MLFRWLTLFLDFPAGSFGPGVAFWREVTGTALSPSRGAAGEFATLLPPDGDAYQAADRAVALGAAVRHASEGLVIADSPGGFTFCLVRWHGEDTVPRRPPEPGARTA